MKVVRNIFIAITILLLVPLLWHAIAPMSLCWMQTDQIGVSIFCVLAFGIAAFGTHVEMDS